MFMKIKFHFASYVFLLFFLRSSNWETTVFIWLLRLCKRCWSANFQVQRSATFKVPGKCRSFQ